MLRIKINGTDADIQGTSFRMVLNNPAFSEDALVGDHSYSVSFPGTEHNKMIFGFQHRSDIGFIAEAKFPIVINLHGNDVFSGTFTLDKAAEFFSGNIQAGASALIALFENMTTNQVDYGDTLNFPGSYEFNQYVDQAQESSYPDYNFTWFPVLNRNLFEGAPEDVIAWWAEIQYINYTYDDRNLYVLFPYLPFVINSIFKSSGYRMNPNMFDSGELSTLVLYSPFRDTEYESYKHNHKDHVGRFKIIELLNGIRSNFNVGFFTRYNSNEVNITPLKDLLISDILDWTDKIVDIHERDFSYEYPDGYLFEYNWDSGCKTISGFLKEKLDPADYIVLPPVTTRSLLNIGNVSNEGAICLVLDESAYYRYTVIAPEPTEPPMPTFYSWSFFSYAFLKNQTSLGERKTESTLSTLLPSKRPGIIFNDHPVPCSDQAIIDPEGFVSSQMMFHYWNRFNLKFLNDIQPRLLFYRGMNPISKAVFASCDYNVGYGQFEMSLDWNGDHGLFAYWHKDWVSFLDSASLHIFKVMLTATDLINLDLRKRIQIGANLYLIRKIEVNLPMDAPASIELMRINGR